MCHGLVFLDLPRILESCSRAPAGDHDRSGNIIDYLCVEVLQGHLARTLKLGLSVSNKGNPQDEHI